MALASMTGYADLSGTLGAVSWVWEARSVNGRNFDLRARLPEGFDSLEPRLRSTLLRVLSRGSVTVALRVVRDGAQTAPKVSAPALEMAIEAARAAAEAADRHGVLLAPMTAADLLSLRGVLEFDGGVTAGDPELMAALEAAIDVLAARLRGARLGEGAEVTRSIRERVDRIEALIGQAREAAGARGPRAATQLRARVDAILGQTNQVDENRLAQELALIAVKSDVAEELDRLDAHVAAARKLIAADGAVGRRLDFLTQEFNREANTLCAKAGAADLTAIGLEMKVAIDQLREQVQNVE